MNPINPFDRIKATNELQAVKALETQRHEEMKLALIGTQETILKAFNSFVKYLDNKVTKAEVVNQLQSIGTPDAFVVADAVDKLHSTIQAQEDVDLTPIAALVQQLLDETKQIPKELPTIPENEKQIDYSKQFKAMSDAVKAVESAVKAQELKVDAPIVNVPETVLNVDAPDFTTLEKGNKDLVKAIKGIVIPDYIPTDISPLVKEQKKTNKILMELPSGGGGGGGGSIAPFLVNGALPVSMGAGAATTNQSSPAVTTSSAVILASNTSRLGATIYNEGTVACFVRLGATASVTSYTVKMAVDGYYELPFNYTGAINGITSSGTATLRVTEIVA